MPAFTAGKVHVQRRNNVPLPPPPARKVRIGTETECLFRAQSVPYPPRHSYVYIVKLKTPDSRWGRLGGSLSTSPADSMHLYHRTVLFPRGVGSLGLPSIRQRLLLLTACFPASLSLCPPDEWDGACPPTETDPDSFFPEMKRRPGLELAVLPPHLSTPFYMSPSIVFLS